MGRKRGFTMEEHWTMGNLLYHTRAALQAQFLAISKAYPFNSRVVRQLERALKGVEAVQSEMDSAMYREHPEEADPQIYYAEQRLGGR